MTGIYQSYLPFTDCLAYTIRIYQSYLPLIDCLAYTIRFIWVTSRLQIV